MSGQRLKVYVAASMTRLREARALVARLESFPVTVVSRWVEHAAPASDHHLSPSQQRVGAEMDLRDVQECDVLLFLAEHPTAGYLTGGRHVEFGMAYAWGKPISVVGPRENVFHHLPRCRHFDDVDGWLRYYGFLPELPAEVEPPQSLVLLDEGRPRGSE